MVLIASLAPPHHGPGANHPPIHGQEPPEWGVLRAAAFPWTRGFPHAVGLSAVLLCFTSHLRSQSHDKAYLQAFAPLPLACVGHLDPISWPTARAVLADLKSPSGRGCRSNV